MSFLSDGTFFYKNAGEDWSQTANPDGTYRFEVRGDDYFSSPSIPVEASDITLGKNRSELVTLQKLQEGREFVFDFDFMVEAGATNTADWLLLAQFHQTEDTNPDGSLIDAAASPPLALQLRGERLEIVGRTDPNAATLTSPDNIQMFLDTNPIERGKFYNIRFEMVFDDDVAGNGMLKVFLDGVQIVDYSGPLGYNDAVGTYAQFGVYREQSPETIAAQYRNISLTSPEPAPPINGSMGDDMLDADKVGFLENEVLNGYAGNDTLSGGYGADTMNGGSGDDYYIVNHAGDVVNERSGAGADEGGRDLVQSYVSYTLGADIEDLTLWADTDINGTGNAKDNVIRGNTGRNTLRGAEGDDSILADSGNDTVFGGNGLDTLSGGDGDDMLYGDAGHDRLFGEAGNDRLYGGDGNDTLESGAGDDTLYGGDGDDEYAINHSGDLIVEAANGGRDTVRASVSFDAGATGEIEVLNTSNQSATATLNLSGTDLDNEIRGNNGRNILIGRAGHDQIFGFGGDDTLQGDTGNDTLFGGQGADSLIGGGGSDQIEGEAGNDILRGEGDDDRLYGGDGNDVLFGGDGIDLMLGGAGDDSLDGGASSDSMFGDAGFDTLEGGDGNNALYGGADDDLLRGGAGNDTLEGGAGFDTMEGGTGNDQYVVDGTGGILIELAGEGSDTLRAAVSFDVGAGNEIEFISTTNQSGTTAIDLTGDNSVNEMRGNNGANTLSGRDGDDRIFGYAGNDILHGDAGNDSLLGGDGQDTLYGGLGNDTLNGESGNGALYGGDGADSLIGSDGNTQMFGDAGNDILRGGSGQDTLYGGDGDDSYYVINSSTQVVEAAGGGTDTIRTSVSFTLATDAEVEVLRVTDQATTGALNLTGSDSANELRGNNGNNRLDGGAGDDVLRGFLGDDSYIVDSAGDKVFEADGQGNDTIITSINYTIGSTVFVETLQTADDAGTDALWLAGNQMANTLRGNAGANRLSGGDGDDTLIGLGGNDTIYGGLGSDTVVFNFASTTANAAAGANSMVLTSVGAESMISNDVEFFVFSDRTLTYAEATLLRSAVVDPVLRGTAGNDTLFGGAGDDTILGDAGDDSLVGNGGNDSIQGDAGNDLLRGNQGADSLYGGSGNDTIYGAADGANYMDGGDGDDSYYIENSSTQVVEAAGGGTDTIRTSVSFTLATDAEVEVLRVTDQATTGALNLTGSDSANELRGNNGNNRLDGGAGDDVLRGFLGDDSYIVDSAGDKVFEADGQGNDTIITSINYTIGSTVFVETLQTGNDAGTDALWLTGNQMANTLRGNAGANRLSGGDGDDTLIGLGGNDTIYGGLGSDRVVLNVNSTEANASAGGSSMVLTTAEGADFISNDVEFFVFNDRTLTYAEASALRHSFGPAPIVGTNSAENVNGTSDSELIQAMGGNDWITPGTGSDTIDGGDGRDMLSFVNLPDTTGRTNVQYRLDLDLTAGRAATSGQDIYEISNVERVTGTIFADRIKGSAGADELRGLGDYDWFVATTGADTIDGGTGADMVSYVDWQNDAAGVSVDPLATNGRPPSGGITTGVVVDLANTANNTNLAAGHSYISVERITGTGRADVFWGDGNENDFRGLGDYDWFVGSSGGRERYFGGDGIDTVTYFQSTSGVIASLSNGAKVGGQETGYGTGGDAARDLYFEIENLVGSNHDDVLTGNAGRNTLMGLDGDDFLFGGAGIDMLQGGAGLDMIDGGAGSDYAVFSGNLASYTLTKTSSNTVTVSGADGVDSLINVEYFRFDDGDTNIWLL